MFILSKPVFLLTKFNISSTLNCRLYQNDSYWWLYQCCPPPPPLPLVCSSAMTAAMGGAWSARMIPSVTSLKGNKVFRASGEESIIHTEENMYLTIRFLHVVQILPYADGLLDAMHVPVWHVLKSFHPIPVYDVVGCGCVLCQS